MKGCDSSTPNTAHMGFSQVSFLNFWAGSGNNVFFLSSKSLVCLIEKWECFTRIWLALSYLIKHCLSNWLLSSITSTLLQRPVLAIYFRERTITDLDYTKLAHDLHLSFYTILKYTKACAHYTCKWIVSGQLLFGYSLNILLSQGFSHGH